MNKAEFIAYLAGENDISKADAEKITNIVINGFMQALSQGHTVNLVGFGSFAVHKRAAREGRNPKTGAKIRIAAYNQPVFKVGKKFKDTCN
ncbi:MAG: HU family DNA-binding protein [Rickettsiaceae bacterium]|nr:HU family DNA-binding protein [Rickettsiaceae bacterium]